MTGHTPSRAGLLLVVTAAATLTLAGCSGGTSTVCSNGSCRTTVSSAPTTVDEPSDQFRGSSSSRSRTTTSRASDPLFTVTALAPGSVQVGGAVPAATVPVGGTFAADGRTVTVASSDGRSAVFTYPD